MSYDLSILQMRKRLGWATPGDLARLARLEAEEARNWQAYDEAMAHMRDLRPSDTARPRTPIWMRAMGPDDYIDRRTRRVVTERESIEEQRARIKNL